MNAQDIFSAAVQTRPKIAVSRTFGAELYIPVLQNAGYVCVPYSPRLDDDAPIALVSAVDYARHERQGWRVYKNAALSWTEEAPVAFMDFGDGRTPEAICVKESPRLFWHWLDLILTERYETDAHPVDECTQGVPQLISGFEALENKSSAFWSIAEQWWEMTAAPMVTHLWIIREKYDEEEVQRWQRIFTRPFVFENDKLQRVVRKHLNRSFDDAVAKGLSAFYRYAFYHGRIEHIPEIRFWGEQDDTEIKNGESSHGQ